MITQGGDITIIALYCLQNIARLLEAAGAQTEPNNNHILGG